MVETEARKKGEKSMKSEPTPKVEAKPEPKKVEPPASKSKLAAILEREGI
jgi:hypothetical protein